MGHLQRALNLRDRIGPCTILHQGPETPGTTRLPRPSPAEVQALLQGADRVVVDVFPGGVGHELEDLPDRSVLVARFVRREAYPDYDRLVERFDEVWLPYEASRCEWQEPPPGRFIGPVRRSIALEPREVDLLVIGAGEPPTWTPLLADAERVNGPFERLPRARRVVALQCGYNLAWELEGLGMPVAFRPLPRRFDDQFRRAALLGTPLLHRRDLERFLEATAGQRRQTAVQSAP